MKRVIASVEDDLTAESMRNRLILEAQISRKSASNCEKQLEGFRKLAHKYFEGDKLDNLINKIDAASIYIDEIDNEIHDLLTEDYTRY